MTADEHAGLFPETWRYNPLRWSAKDSKWVNAIAYRTDKRFSGLGDFKGCDVDGIAYFGDNTVTGIPCVKDGIPAVAATAGMAVGIFVKYCDPPLNIVDCDSGLLTETFGQRTRSVSLREVRGRDQLLALFTKRGEPVPYAPAVRGNREGHGYLIFKRNLRAPITTRKIKPFGMHFDVIGNGHQVHWSAPGARALLQGAERLTNPPELPLWFAQLIRHSKGNPVPPGSGSAKFNFRDGGWGSMQLNAILGPVTSAPGAWNQRLFNAACQLAEAGVSLPELRELVLERCGPEDDRERENAIKSIHSAWRRVTGKDVRDE